MILRNGKFSGKFSVRENFPPHITSLNPRTLRPMTSTLTITPPRRLAVSVVALPLSSPPSPRVAQRAAVCMTRQVISRFELLQPGVEWRVTGQPATPGLYEAQVVTCFLFLHAVLPQTWVHNMRAAGLFCISRTFIQ
jgi:hypothetical protein